MELKRILIVEDDADIAAIERDYLELGGYAVTIAPDGTTGLDAALHQPFDLILLDVMLPGIDGFAICKQVRAEKDIPILMVTARGEDVDKIRGLGFGADDYIEKPFSPSVLVARVKAHLAQYARLKPCADTPKTITVGPLPARPPHCPGDPKNEQRWRGSSRPPYQLAIFMAVTTVVVGSLAMPTT